MPKRKTIVRYRNPKRRPRRRGGFKLPLAVVGGFLPMAGGIWQRKTDPANLGKYVLGSLTGYVPGAGWSTQYMAEGAFPILAGFTAHWLASRLGINRALGRARVPLLRI